MGRKPPLSGPASEGDLSPHAKRRPSDRSGNIAESEYAVSDMALFKKRPRPLDLESLDQITELAQTGKPVFLNFFQYGCMPCQTMDGIVNELAIEFEGSAHFVKVNAATAPLAFDQYKVKSTPTFMVLTSKDGAPHPTQRWRASGLVKKDVLVRTLTSAGAAAVE